MGYKQSSVKMKHDANSIHKKNNEKFVIELFFKT